MNMDSERGSCKKIAFLLFMLLNSVCDAKTVSTEDISEGLSTNTGLGQGTSGSGLGVSKYEKYHTSSLSAHAAPAPGLSPQASSNYYTSSSSYGYPGNYGYNNHNNHVIGTGINYSPYMTDPIFERSGKEFHSRGSAPMSSSGNPPYETSASAQQLEYGGLAMASGHHGHHGHGWGWGWGKGGGYTKVDTAGIGLLGLIGLFALLQNVLLLLTTTTTTAATTGRKKRDADGQDETQIRTREEDGIAMANRISLLVFPALNVIAHARQGVVPLECTHREVCIANHILVKELGTQGRSVGKMMSSAIGKMLMESDKSGIIQKRVNEAALSGRNGGNCHKTYPVCIALSPGGSSSLPALMEPQQLLQVTGSSNSENGAPKASNGN